MSQVVSALLRGCVHCHRAHSLSFGQWIDTMRAMQTLEFVHVSSSEIDGNNAAVAGSADRRRIRSLVMRDFRRKERERRRTTGNAIDGTSAGLGQDEKANDIAQDNDKVAVRAIAIYCLRSPGMAACVWIEVDRSLVSSRTS
jgi:hypothetical protein